MELTQYQAVFMILLIFFLGDLVGALTKAKISSMFVIILFFFLPVKHTVFSSISSPRPPRKPHLRRMLRTLFEKAAAGLTFSRISLQISLDFFTKFL